MIRIDSAQLRVKRIRQSRNGAFCVADLSTDIGEFKVKDPLLEQFDEGEYQATVWISEIYLSQYIAFGKGVTEMRARLHDIQINTQGALRSEPEPVEPDPLDEREPTRMVHATQTPRREALATKKSSKDFERFRARAANGKPSPKGTDAEPAPPIQDPSQLFGNCLGEPRGT